MSAPGVLPAGHPPVAFGKVGLLLVNLGTPEATDYWSMRRYLSQFLSDRRVIEVSPWFWQPLLQGVILTTRPKKSGAAYDEIWNRERNESPLKTITRDQAEGLAARLADLGDRLVVDWAMRYGQPALGERIEALHKAGCERILIMPLYPQYSAATTATVMDESFRKLMKLRWQPSLRGLPPYHDDPAYIAALAQSLTAFLAGLEWQPQAVIASYHGLPQEYFDKGDPYHCHCHKTNRLLREHLGWSEDFLRLTFQSRFGRAEWLQPYTDETLEALPGEGVTRVVVITPGFAADCVETLEEIAIAGRESFAEAGGTHYAVVPCLNASEPGLDLLEALARRELAGWSAT